MGTIEARTFAQMSVKVTVDAEPCFFLQLKRTKVDENLHLHPHLLCSFDRIQGRPIARGDSVESPFSQEAEKCKSCEKNLDWTYPDICDIYGRAVPIVAALETNLS